MFSMTVSLGKILVSWRNNLVGVTQISIQRSFDSLKNFTTLLTVPAHLAGRAAGVALDG